jgi:nitrogen fixation/metabolism regulation signal transduction histidine kinase
MKWPKPAWEVTLGSLVLAAAFPFALLALLDLAGWRPPWILGFAGFAVAWGITFWIGRALVRFVARPLRLGAAQLQAVREGDYSIRSSISGKGAMRELFVEINQLSHELSGVRQSGIESDALLGRLLANLELSVLVFDPDDRLSGLNRAAVNLLGEPATALRGRAAADLGLADWLRVGGQVFVTNRRFASGVGPWEVRTLKFRRGGRPHTLLVMTDASRTLREEERRAWRRLIRVLGHEINNSLGPIASVADTLQGQIAGRGEEGRLREGLALIERRARSLTHFIGRYSDYARMPPPSFAPVQIRPLVREIASMEVPQRLRLEEGPDVVIQADQTQVEQALINLLRNAVEAATPSQGWVTVSWRETEDGVMVEILDEGPGLPSSQNLFVPFFTTKPGGSGIGLLIAREVAENHGGHLELRNRTGTPGVVACLHLARAPRSPVPAPDGTPSGPLP